MLRTPLVTLYSKTVTSTASSSDTFTLPFSDYSGLVAKLTVATIASGAANQLNVYIQTTDDAGTTYYDTVAFGTVTAKVANANSLFYTIPVDFGSFAYAGNLTTSATSNYVGSTSGSGLPLLSNQVRVVWAYGALTDTATANFTIKLYATNQSPHS